MVIPASLPDPPGNFLFKQGESAFHLGDYVGAIQDYEHYLESVPGGSHAEQALFRLGLSYVLQTKPPANWTQATASFGRLVKEHPESSLAPAANLILSLRSYADQVAKDAKARKEVVQQLNAALEKLRKIDTDRRAHP
jgi:TolA-binding protein